jgi:hypothetical protein
MSEFTDVFIQCPTKDKNHGHDSYFTTAEDGKVDEEQQKCEKCGKRNLILLKEKCNDPEEILQLTENELEGANYHEMTSIPSKIYQNVFKLVSKKNRAKLARGISEGFSNL